MNTICYPAFFHREDVGYSVTVPDLPGCFTQGDSMAEAVQMTQDAIGLFLEGEAEVKPTAPELMQAPEGDFLVVIPFDQLDYQRRNNNRAVKKTLTVPAWLNDMAESANLNFSRVLQNALKKELNVK